MGEDAVADESRDAAEENSGADQKAKLPKRAWRAAVAGGGVVERSRWKGNR